MYPVFLDLAGKRVLVVGAGAVAARKIRGLLECGLAELRVVSPEISTDLPEGVTVLLRGFEDGDLDGIDLCFIATGDSEVNERVMKLCRSKRILANRADRGKEGDFTIPAIHRDGPVTVAVSASGSPRLAANVRDEIAQKIDRGWGRFAATVQSLRNSILKAGLEEDRRREILIALCSSRALAAFKAGGDAAVRSHLTERFEELKEAAW